MPRRWPSEKGWQTSFNLIEGIDVPVLEAKIANYQEENAEQIINARARKAEELAAALAASKGQPAQADSTIDGAPSQNSQAGGGQGQYAPAIPGATIGQPRPTGMAPQPVPVGYAADDKEMMKLRAERGGRAGGWSAEMSRKRAIEEAFASIWI
ncbi:uncharacterized protein LOC122670529 isoform X2 [Telopea speciosissima]|uniref:uncharacterized protein LOC122670529 isoform X2 n=1 Tax=Telopea speciosissima TaxID=54955 RepID=UPI001CC6C8E1|nr:uncharacterized protein LOC122670529 isoform X2 [Telopea speciosissima]